MTRYLVLRKTGSHEGAGWASMSTVEARSDKEAIRKAVAPKPDSEEPAATGEFVAVPARSWKPVKVEVKTQTKLTFS